MIVYTIKSTKHNLNNEKKKKKKEFKIDHIPFVAKFTCVFSPKKKKNHLCAWRMWEANALCTFSKSQEHVILLRVKKRRDIGESRFSV